MSLAKVTVSPVIRVIVAGALRATEAVGAGALTAGEAVATLGTAVAATAMTDRARSRLRRGERDERKGILRGGLELRGSAGLTLRGA